MVSTPLRCALLRDKSLRCKKNKIMKLLLYLSTVWALSSLNVFAQGISYSVSPALPEFGDNIIISLSQAFPDPGYTSISSITKSGFSINITVTSEIKDGYFRQAITPQEVLPSIGQLSAGTYTVVVDWNNAPSWGESSTSFTFDVTESNSKGELEIMNSIALKFPTLPDKVYQIQYSEDIEEWHASGENIVGNGSSKIVYRLTKRPKRFFRVIQFDE